MSIIDEIRAENLRVYEVSPDRLREDVSQEEQVASNYSGRIIYEMLQNADDAMREAPSHEDRIVFRLTDEELWVGNSGRPLKDVDARGLCALGAGSKGLEKQDRRASIGHKGMGFKSVLEITDSPEVYSTTYSFRLGSSIALGPIQDVFHELGLAAPAHVPAMRLPQVIDQAPDFWNAQQAQGIRTLFRLPLSETLDPETRGEVRKRLRDLPLTSVLFLKHLEHVDIEIDDGAGTEHVSWKIRRSRAADGTIVNGASDDPLQHVSISKGDEVRHFLVAHNPDVEIGGNREGLPPDSWESVRVTEVSVACLLDSAGGRPVPIPAAWQHLHVFLPTAEPSPYPFLINGAFESDLSRTAVHVHEPTKNYNRFLLREAAALFGARLVPQIIATAGELAVLEILQRPISEPGEMPDRPTGAAIVEAFRQELGRLPFVPADTEDPLRPIECAVPGSFDDSAVGASLRGLLVRDARYEGSSLPSADACRASNALTLADLGALVIEPGQLPSAICSNLRSDIELVDHPSGRIQIDPVIDTLARVWHDLPGPEASDFEEAVREEKLFPVATSGSEIIRIDLVDQGAFYPPRTLHGDVPLGSIRFLLRAVCWGTLGPAERGQVIADEMVAWTALFDLEEFRFPAVISSSVLPLLTLNSEPQARAELEDLDKLAAICQLAGPSPNSERPLRFERYGANRNIWTLSRLPVPCRGYGDSIRWLPAYRAYFGTDWIGEDSVEHLLERVSWAPGDAPEVGYLVAPELLEKHLEKFTELGKLPESDDLEDQAADEEGADDEVAEDADFDEPVQASTRAQLTEFLEWIGVNKSLRLIHFHDVEDRGGWQQTRGLLRPAGGGLARESEEEWSAFEDHLRHSLPDEAGPSDRYFFDLHRLDLFDDLAAAVAADERADSARALYRHLSAHWAALQRRSDVKVAVVRAGLRINARVNKLPTDDEFFEPCENYWLWKAKRSPICPTTRGPRRPVETWFSAAGLSGSSSSATDGSAASRRLLPVLDAGPADDQEMGFAKSLGLRMELSSATFQAEDARAMLAEIRRTWENSDESNREMLLRSLVRPTYRRLAELLPGATENRSGFEQHVLSDTEVLVRDGSTKYCFVPASDAILAERAGTFDRLGQPANLPILVLEGAPQSRAPFSRFLGMKTLDEALEWQQQPGDPALEGPDLERFRDGLRSVAPFLLARLEADRAAEAEADRARLARLVETLEPVESLESLCFLDGKQIPMQTNSGGYASPRLATEASFIVWGDNPWPPDDEEAERLASVLCDGLGVNAVEAFVALLGTNSETRRRRLLRLAGAADPVDTSPLTTDGDPGGTALEKTADRLQPVGNGAGGEPEPPPEPIETFSVAKTPLYRFEDLILEGDPVTIFGDAHRPDEKPPDDTDDHRSRGGGPRSRAGGPSYGGRTHLPELDQLGMAIAMAYERRRLGSSGAPSGSELLVFDISTRDALVESAENPDFQTALQSLADAGVNPEAPGFDILSLSPSTRRIDRIIELKSSGANSNTQDLTWNEWKTARNSKLRTHFYLYLAANLRSDTGARPYLRTIQDPFDTLLSEKVEDRSSSKKVRLLLKAFKQAEDFQLGVRTN